MAEAKARGVALYQKGKFADAVVAYDESLAIDRTVAPTHANKAAALLGQGRAFFKQALECCLEAVAIDPGYTRAKTRLGCLITKLGELDFAVAFAETLHGAANTKNSQGTETLLTQLRLLRNGRQDGNNLFKSGNLEQAKERFTDALVAAARVGSDSRSENTDDPTTLASVPGSGLLLCNRAACFASLGEHALALNDVDAVLENDPEYLKAILRRAHALIALGRRNDAETAFSRLRQALPGDQNIAKSLNDLRGTQTETAGVVHVTSTAQYKQLTKNAKLVLVDFTAKWCGPCKQIAPHFSNLALTYPDVHFLKVDVDENAEVAALEIVRSMPTFKVYRYGAKTEEFSGADQHKLKALIEKYLPTVG